jgi:transposase InsO family protein
LSAADQRYGSANLWRPPNLDQEGIRPPSTSTIRRILIAAGLISPEPKKRPKSSYRRFEADQPNECWQSDFTHWQLADGTGVEIINWLDDHSRYLLANLGITQKNGHPGHPQTQGQGV